eukprot:scaffold8836_cov109-Isochrysis_galbana.AAC.1
MPPPAPSLAPPYPHPHACMLDRHVARIRGARRPVVHVHAHPAYSPRVNLSLAMYACTFPVNRPIFRGKQSPLMQLLSAVRARTTAQR